MSIFFSEHGAGVQPLVVIGTLPELVIFFIIIDMSSLQMKFNHYQIYIGVFKFVEKKRYDGTFPINNAISTLATSILDFVPGSTITDVLSNSITFGTILKKLIQKDTFKEKQVDLLI